VRVRRNPAMAQAPLRDARYEHMEMASAAGGRRLEEGESVVRGAETLRDTPRGSAELMAVGSRMQYPLARLHL
jgi:hypothetical protein